MTLLNESRAVDLQIRWAELALESAQLQYDIAVSESSDGVLTESENEYLFMEAEQAAKKSKNIILRAIEKVIDFIKSVASKIAAAFSEKKVKSDLDEIKKIQNDPNVKSAEVEVPDWKDAEKNVKEYEKAIANAEKKAKAGTLTQADLDKMNDAKEKCKNTKKVVIGAAAGAVALGGLVLGYKKRTDAYQKDLESFNQEVDRLYDEMDKYTEKNPNGAKVIAKDTNKLEKMWAFKNAPTMINMAKIDMTNLMAKLEPMYAAAYKACTGAAKSAWSKVSGVAQNVKNKVSKKNSSDQNAAGQTS